MSPNKELKTSKEWTDTLKTLILDPDGWDRVNFEYSWYEELITEDEFKDRVSRSTCYGRRISFE